MGLCFALGVEVVAAAIGNSSFVSMSGGFVAEVVDTTCMGGTP